MVVIISRPMFFPSRAKMPFVFAVDGVTMIVMMMTVMMVGLVPVVLVNFVVMMMVAVVVMIQVLVMVARVDVMSFAVVVVIMIVTPIVISSLANCFEIKGGGKAPGGR